MQYLLTEAEYMALKDSQTKRAKVAHDKMQGFCTQAAMHIPVTRHWAPSELPAPWGCILGPREQHPGYCDKCPAQDLCPYEGKEWSQ